MNNHFELHFAPVRRTEESLVAVVKMGLCFLNYYIELRWSFEFQGVQLCWLITSLHLFKIFIINLALENDVNWKNFRCYQENKKYILSNILLKAVAHRRNQWDQMRKIDSSHSDWGKEMYSWRNETFKQLTPFSFWNAIGTFSPCLASTVQNWI